MSFFRASKCATLSVVVFCTCLAEAKNIAVSHRLKQECVALPRERGQSGDLTRDASYCPWQNHTVIVLIHVKPHTPTAKVKFTNIRRNMAKPGIRRDSAPVTGATVYKDESTQPFLMSLLFIMLEDKGQRARGCHYKSLQQADACYTESYCTIRKKIAPLQ